MANSSWMDDFKTQSKKSSSSSRYDDEPQSLSGVGATSMMQQIMSRRNSMIKEAAVIVCKRLHSLDDKITDIDKIARLIDDLFVDPNQTFSDKEKYEILKYAIATYLMEKY